MEFLIFGIFFLTSGIYLYFEWNEKRRETQIQKLFLMPSLLVSAYLYAIFKNWTMPLDLGIALCFGFLGDAFLLKNENRSIFQMGIVSFLAGHLLYGWIMIKSIKDCTLFLVFLIGLVYVSILFLFLKKYDDKKGFTYFYILYGGVILLFALSSTVLFLQDPNRVNMMIFTGAHLFVLSDMGILKDYKEPKRWSPVILLYISGQFLLTLGILLKTNI